MPNFRRHQLPRLTGASGRRLQSVVRLGRRICASELSLQHQRRRWMFRLARRGEVLLEGVLDEDSVTLGG